MMLKNLATILLSFCLLYTYSQTNAVGRIKVAGEIKDVKMRAISYAHIVDKSRNEGWVGDYYGRFQAYVYPGDTLMISAISYHPEFIYIPSDLNNQGYHVEIIMQQDTIQMKELVIYPWPATYSQLKKDFLKVEIEDPMADIDLNLPSLKDSGKFLNTPMEPGQIGIYSGPGPFSILYNQFSKEARSKRIYAEILKKEKVDKRYNKATVSRITGLKGEDEIKKFMDFCSLQIKFILESTDYELYAAILNCYDEFCREGLLPVQTGE